METVVLDGLIRMLLDGRNDKQVSLSYEVISQLRQLCTEGKKIFLSQPNLLRLTAPITICGDISGQFQDLLKIFTLRGYPPNSTYLFLGNYVDHRTQNFKTLCLLLAYKVKYPDRIFLLRGNQERGFGHRYGIWKEIKDCFDCLPFAGLVEEKIFCVHGGLSPELHRPEEIKDIKRPIEIPDHGLLFDLIWSDPHPDTAGWGPSERGVPHFFGPDMLAEFLDKNDLDLVCRSHSVVEDGYEFFAERRLVTIFSAPNYRGEFSNAGALLVVDETLLCSFEVFGSQVKGLKSVPYKICQNMIVSKEVGSKNVIEKYSSMIVSKEVKPEIFSGHLHDEFMGIDLSDFSTWESPTEVANHGSFAGPDSGEAAYKDTLNQLRILRTADFSSSVPVAAIHDCIVATTKALELRGLSHGQVSALRNLRSDLLPLASKLFSHCQAMKSLKTTMEAVEQQSIDCKQKREFLEERTEALKRKKEEYVFKDLELNRLRAEVVRLEEEAAELKASVDRDLSAVRTINNEVVGGFAELKKANAALPTYRKQLSEEETAVEEHSRRLNLLFDMVEDL